MLLLLGHIFRGPITSVMGDNFVELDENKR